MLTLRTVLLTCSLASLYQAGVIHEPKSTPDPKDFVTAVCDSSNANEKIIARDCRTAFLAFPFENNGTQLRNHKRSLQSVFGTCNITLSTTNRHSFEVSVGRLLHGKDVQDKGGLEGVLKQCPGEPGSILIEGGTHHKGGNIELIVSPAVGGVTHPYPTGEESPYPDGSSSSNPSGSYPGGDSSYPGGGSSYPGGGSSYPGGGSSYPGGGSSYPGGDSSYPGGDNPSDPNDPADRPPVDPNWGPESKNNSSGSPSPGHSIPADPIPGGMNSSSPYPSGNSSSPYPSGNVSSPYPGSSSSPYPDGSAGSSNSTNSSSTFTTAQCTKGDGLKKLDEEDCRTAFLDLPFDCDSEKLKVDTSSISRTENGCTVVITAMAGRGIEVSSGRLLDGVDGNGGIDALFKQCGDHPGSIAIEGGATDETNVKISITSSVDQPLKSRSKRHVDTELPRKDDRGLSDVLPMPQPFQCNPMETINHKDCEDALDLFPFSQGTLESEETCMTRTVRGCTVELQSTQGRTFSTSKKSLLDDGLLQLWEKCPNNAAGKITAIPDLPDVRIIDIVVSGHV